jgi:hypothetical protein
MHRRLLSGNETDPFFEFLTSLRVGRRGGLVSYKFCIDPIILVVLGCVKQCTWPIAHWQNKTLSFDIPKPFMKWVAQDSDQKLVIVIQQWIH